MPRRHTIPRVTTLIIHPKVRGFICTTTHPLGCELNVRDQIAATRAQGVRNDGPKKVLVIGASSGYGLAARISAAFGFGADTLGVFFEKPGSEKLELAERRCGQVRRIDAAHFKFMLEQDLTVSPDEFAACFAA